MNNNSSEMKHISTLREAFSQILAVIGKNFILVTFGTTLGFPTILLGALQNKPDIYVNTEQLTWMSSIHYFVMPIGCLLSGIISDYFGRKKTMLLTNIPFITGWIILHFAKSVPLILFALALLGITGGLIEAPVLTYVSEITQSHLRGMLASTATLAVIAGVFSQMLAGSLTDWRTVTLINLAYPMMAALALSLLPESPYWLAGKGRILDAKKSLQWLRGWTTSTLSIDEELQTICQMVTLSLDKDNNSTKTNKWSMFKKRNFLSPFILITIAYFIASFGGAATLQTYSVFIFGNMQAPIDKYTATVYLGIAETLGTLVCVAIIHFMGRRLLSFISVCGTGICFLSCTIYSYLILFNKIDTDSYSWLPTTFLIGAAFLAHTCIRLLPFLLVGEVFPTSIRSTASGATTAVYYIFLTIANKTFLSLVNELKLSGIFILYTVINFVGGIALYFLLPETEGKTLKQIEDYYANVNVIANDQSIKKMEMNEKLAISNEGYHPDEIESKL